MEKNSIDEDFTRTATISFRVFHTALIILLMPHSINLNASLSSFSSLILSLLFLPALLSSSLSSHNLFLLCPLRTSLHAHCRWWPNTSTNTHELASGQTQQPHNATSSNSLIARGSRNVVTRHSWLVGLCRSWLDFLKCL